MIRKTFILTVIFAFSRSQKLQIEESGLINFGATDHAMVFFIQVIEEGPTSSRIYVEGVECCETMASDETDCETIRLMGGDMDIVPYGKSRNLTLFYPTLYGYNRRGSCLVDITFNSNTTKLRHRIDFDTVISSDAIPNGLEPFYDPAKIVPCSSLDLDPFVACEPVSCQAKYNGLRNYFNKDTERCEKAAVCEEGTVYIPISNTCRVLDPPVTDEDLVSIGEQLPISDKEDAQAEVICHRGHAVLGTCVCDPGWETIRDDDSSVSTLHQCNVPCPGSIFNTPSLILFNIFDLICAFFLVALVLILIHRHNKKFQIRNKSHVCYNDSENVAYFQLPQK